MSYCKEEGKDKVIFLTKEDYDTPSTATLSQLEEEPGLILDNGDINWQCPCLGGMAAGPCGVEFREAFSCFHYSPEEVKGAECYNEFKQMQDCMGKYPDLYDSDKEDKAEVEVDAKQESLENDTTFSEPNYNEEQTTSVNRTEEAVAS